MNAITKMTNLKSENVFLEKKIKQFKARIKVNKKELRKLLK